MAFVLIVTGVVCVGTQVLAQRRGAAVVEDAAAFIAADQLELVENRIREAAEAFVAIYSRDAAFTPDLTQASTLRRLEAAFRAGACFERIGNVQRAERAYRWLVAHHDRARVPGAALALPQVERVRALRDRAALRSLALDPAAASASPSDAARTAVLNDLQRGLTADREAQSALRFAVDELRERRAALDVLWARLVESGVEPGVMRPDPALEFGDLFDDWLARTVPDAMSRTALSAALARSFLARALLEVEGGAIARARWSLALASALAPERADARSLGARLGEGVGPTTGPAGLRRLARLRAQSLASSPALEARHRARLSMRLADALERPDRRLRELLVAVLALVRVAPAESSHPEIVGLLERARTRSLLAAGPALDEPLSSLLGECESLWRSLLGAAEELVLLVAEEHVLRTPRVDPPPGEGRPFLTRTVVEREVRALEDRLSAEAFDPLERRVLAVEFDALRAWFPTLIGVTGRPGVSTLPPLRPQASGGARAGEPPAEAHARDRAGAPAEIGAEGPPPVPAPGALEPLRDP